MGTDAGIPFSHMLMNPLCKKLPGLQPEPHHQILNTIPPASTVLWCFGLQGGLSPVSVHRNSVEPSEISILSLQPCILARSGRVSCCTTSILMWLTEPHMVHHPSYCPGPTPHDFHAFGLLKKALMGLRFRSKVRMLQCCNSLSSCPGSSLQRGPFNWCVGDTCFSTHRDDFVWFLPIA